MNNLVGPQYQDYAINLKLQSLVQTLQCTCATYFFFPNYASQRVLMLLLQTHKCQYLLCYMTITLAIYQSVQHQSVF